MIHTNMPRNCTVFLLPRRLTRSAIYGSQIFTPINGTMLVRKVKGNRAISMQFFVDHCILLRTSFYPYAFYNKRLQTLFIDQIVRSFK